MKEKKRTIHKALWLVPILLVLVAASGWSFDYQQTFYDLMDQLFQIDSEGHITPVQSAWDTPVDFPVFIIRYDEPYLYSYDASFFGYNISATPSTWNGYVSWEDRQQRPDTDHPSNRSVHPKPIAASYRQGVGR